MCKVEFVDYANQIRNYCNKLSEIGEIANIEIFESSLADPTDMMMDMLFALANHNLGAKAYEDFSEEFWHLIFSEDTDNSDWEDFYCRLIEG